MKKNQSLIYYCTRYHPVINSQVIELLKYLNETGYFSQITLIIGINKHDIKDFHLPSSIKVLTYKRAPEYPILNVINYLRIKKLLSDENISPADVIFHTRGELAGSMINKIIQNKTKHKHKLLVDIRGISSLEVKNFIHSSKVTRYLKYLLFKKAMVNVRSCRISTVSPALKDYLINEYKYDSNNICITNSLAGDQFKYDADVREQIRERLCIKKDERVLVLSIGESEQWQDSTAALAHLFNEGFKVILLSQSKYEHKNLISMYVDYKEVYKYLNAADYGIIFRHNNIINKAASPVKFSEYLACGLPVISNNNVDMISDIIKKYNIGLLINDLSELSLSRISSHKTPGREYISKIGRKLFSKETIVTSYLNIYKNI